MDLLPLASLGLAVVLLFAIYSKRHHRDLGHHAQHMEDRTRRLNN